jgi:hypothetical protein
MALISLMRLRSMGVEIATKPPNLNITV